MKLPFEERNFELIKKEEIKLTNPKEKSVKELLERGMIILDKPPGPTSHQAVDYLKKILDVKKAGHSGTLDPNVTGALPVALNKATRITNALLPAGKEYVCLMHLHDLIEENHFKGVMDKFIGKITQLPPKKSAVKRAYRERTIYYMKILDVKDKDVLFLVGCQGGTYIRKLVHDIGEKLGCGAHMTELRRTKAGPFKEEESHTLQDIADAIHFYKKGNEKYIKPMLKPIESAVGHLKKIYVYDSAIQSLSQGAFLKMPGVAAYDSDINPNDLVAVMTLSQELILIGSANLSANELKRSKKGIVITTKQVFITPDYALSMANK